MRCLGCMKEYSGESNVCPYCGYAADTKPSASNHLAPGTLLAGRYLIGRALGSGGFGITYIGWDSRNSRPVAIKEYLPGVFAYRVPGQNAVACYDKDCTAKFNVGIAKTIEESNCLARFNTLNGVVDVFNCVEENGTVYIIMDYLEGKTLKEDLAENGKYTFSEAVTILQPILNALDEIHGSDIIHRDISPDNIFLCNNGMVKLIDFGAARAVLGDDQKSLSIVLKRGYAPKEQYSGQAKQGPYTDVYATAATLYRMITGNVPQESLEREAKDNLLPPSALGVEMPAFAEEALMRALAINAEDRTRTAGEFLRQLTDPNAAVPTEKEQKKDEPAAPAPTPEKPKKTKKHIIIVLLVVLILAAVTAVAVGLISGRKKVLESGICGEGVSWQYNAGGELVLGGSGRMYDYQNEADIPWAAFEKDIQSVTVGSGVQSIGCNAFSHCVMLRDVFISETVSSIGSNAFFGCKSLESAVLPASVSSIGSYAFADCISMSYLHIPASVTSFGVNILADSTAKICSSTGECDAKTYAESNGVVFMICDSDHGIKAPSDSPVPVTSGQLTPPPALATGSCGVNLHWSLSMDGVLTVNGTGGMLSTWVYDEKEHKWASALSPDWTPFADKITSVVIEEGVTDIGNYAFAGLNNLAQIILPNSLNTVGKYAFLNCGALNNFTAPAPLQDIGEGALKNCISLRTVSLLCRITKLAPNLSNTCPALIAVELPAALNEIGESAFVGCVSLPAVTLPGTVTAIGKGAFRHCDKMQTVIFSAGLSEISDYAFAESGLISVAVPSGVELIGNYAFFGCKALQSATMTNSVTAIGAYAFSGCSALSVVVLPDSVTTVGNLAFSDCTNLNYLHMSSGISTVGKGITANCNATVCTSSLILAARYGFKLCSGTH